LEKIIPLYQKYPIIGVKALDFADWWKVALIMKEGGHLVVRENKKGWMRFAK